MAETHLSLKGSGHILLNFKKNLSFIVLITILFVNIGSVDNLTQCKNTLVPKVCGEGDCVNGTCVCFPGWSGEYCEQCSGRISLDQKDGVIYDGSGSEYPKDHKCSWILDTHSDNASVRFVFKEFETECGWDHFYIHDGDSVFAPLLAAYSGLLLAKSDSSPSFEVNIQLSGRYGYLHFYSDAAYVMKGFNILYSVGGCFKNCSERGKCVSGQCQCDAGTSGAGCEVDLKLCLNNCSDNGSCSNGRCSCGQGYRGEDCSLTYSDILWEQQSPMDTPSGRASHVALIRQQEMWVIGGYSLSETKQNKLLRYNFNSRLWSEVPDTGISSNHPWPLYAHSAVLFEDKLYVHGGVRNGIVTDELWVFDIATSGWSKLNSSGYPVSGHTAHVINRTMLVFFGYSPVFGYMNIVQQYNLDSGNWSIVETTGSIVQGSYGHASIYDVNQGNIYIFGGYHSHSDASSSSSYILTDELYAFNIINKEWLVLLSNGHPRYLHSMVLLDEYLLVFGGNTHNDTAKSFGAKCFSSSFMLYDIRCNSWHDMNAPDIEHIARFGHSMLIYNGSLYMFGGFNSLMLNDLIRVDLGNCDNITSKSDCESTVPGSLCTWQSLQGICTQRQKSHMCQPVERDVSVCPRYNTCTSCSNSNCTWCGNNCTLLNCTNVADNASETCPSKEDSTGCSFLHTCQACQDDLRCLWDTSCKPRTSSASITANKTELQAVCKRKPCTVHNNCSSCTNNNCMWCSNLALCIDTNAYVTSFPYAQCMDWTTKRDKCYATECAGIKSCTECLANSRCGWCNSQDNSGLGVCMDGGLSGPVQNNISMSYSPRQCPADRWFFIKCPLCQCNGHAKCPVNSSECGTCDFPTKGDHCQYCEDFYYGNPVNGGNCSECQCHGQADSCNQVTGQCYCNTRGVTGEHCDRCDDVHKYFGDPKNGGTCYYRLTTDYQYTFNLSKNEDINYTQINFLSIPGSGERDVDFTLNCSGFALINITFKSKNQLEEPVIPTPHNCDYFRTKFEHKNYPFGGDSNSTFFVYIYDFKTPFWLQISFSQFPKIDLVHFFITFFSCFLSLLLIAAALWKIKHKYDSYRRRQQLMVEMQQMASRPFSSVCMEVEKKIDPATVGGVPERKELKDHVDTALRRRKKLANKPSAIAIEPAAGNKAAVLTLLVQLPFGDGEFAPSGQSGLAIASALVSLGTTRKQSLEHIKGDKPKIRKHLLYTHPDAFA